MSSVRHPLTTKWHKISQKLWAPRAAFQIDVLLDVLIMVYPSAPAHSRWLDPKRGESGSVFCHLVRLTRQKRRKMRPFWSKTRAVLRIVGGGASSKLICDRDVEASLAALRKGKA